VILKDVIGLHPSSRIALVGAGGKTTALFQAARQYQGTVLLTTTTHLAQDQLEQADQHFEILGPEDLPCCPEDLSGGAVLFTGPPVEENRVGGLTGLVLEALEQKAAAWGLPLLMESDGARKLPIKAPADHEPPIPDFVDTVAVLVGLSGLGKPLTESWVHRPALFSKLAGVPEGTTITSDLLVRVLISARGGIKNIPDGARKILIINQIDEFPNWKTFHGHLSSLLEHFDSVAFGVLEEELILENWHNTAGILLAAGGSKRLGQPKQLLDWGGVPFARAAALTALQAGLDPVIVVTGSNEPEIREVLQDLPVLLVFNPDWEEGQGSSVARGLEMVPETCGGAVFLLSDQPQIPAELIEKLRRTQARTGARIVAPRVDGHQANPVLFDRALFEDLSKLSGDQGGRVLFDKFPIRYVDWNDPGILLDVDTDRDYQQLLETYRDRLLNGK
jgi:molybdenum cofactor cytidylyltransferase